MVSITTRIKRVIEGWPVFLLILQFFVLVTVGFPAVSVASSIYHGIFSRASVGVIQL